MKKKWFAVLVILTVAIYVATVCVAVWKGADSVNLLLMVLTEAFMSFTAGILFSENLGGGDDGKQK